MSECTRPPEGWICEYEEGHRGPCLPHPIPAVPETPRQPTRLHRVNGLDAAHALRDALDRVGLRGGRAIVLMRALAERGFYVGVPDREELARIEAENEARELARLAAAAKQEGNGDGVQ